MASRTWLTLLLLATGTLAGCLGDDDTSDASDLAAGELDLFGLPELVNATFQVLQLPAIHTGHGLYEPTIDVSLDGTIYVSAHSTGLGQLPAPGYYSTDDGASWNTLALAGPAALPPGTQGSAPLFSDEIFIVAGDDGQAWGVDINLHSYIVSGWCDDGATHCYYNPQAYDHAQTVLQAPECNPVPLKDRPWAAYANGTLLLVNNPGGGPMQLGAMQVPPTLYVDAGPVASGIQWNLCASSDGYIPGIPALRGDGFFAVPQGNEGAFHVVTGYASDVMDVQQVPVFQNSNQYASRSNVINVGQAAFDATGALYVGAQANTASQDGPDAGGFQVAVSLDGQNFTETTFRFDRPVSSVYFDGNPNGPGALVNWGHEDGDRTDWYMGHLFVGLDGAPILRHVTMALDDGPDASRHVQGAAVGPDGRSYMVMSENSGNDQTSDPGPGETPMAVVVQQDGPVMPATS
ncbi:MAG: hypothetical protein ACPGQL_03510 [Thermoplasmatota archaeon]